MILIDEDADRKLVQALEALRTNAAATRCIYFSLSDKPAIAGIKEKVTASAKKFIGAHNPKIYFCDDSDIFILAPGIPAKDGREFVLDVADYVKKPVSLEWVGFYEVALHINKLLVIAEQKIENRRKTEEEKRKNHEKQQHERKRQLILNGGGNIAAETIRTRRENRESPELMIIEDDAFSRRLVENVLQKEFSLTGLADANNALDTYARIAPDLLFLDINLPDVTGHELLEKIMALDPDAYVIMLSGNADKDNITQAMQKGAKGFVAKPFNREKLFQYIDRCQNIADKKHHETIS